MMPTTTSESMRIRTGFERMIAHRCNSLYAYSAKQDGKVIDVNEELQLCKIEYKDGSKHVFSYGLDFGECSDLVTTQRKELTIKKGDIFKKDDILCYNPQFFEKDPNSRQVDFKTGVIATVAIMETAGTFEDSNVITKELGDKLSIEPVQVRTITLNCDTFIHKALTVGDEVDINDYLMVFENASVADLSGVSQDEDTLNYLAKLNRVTPKAKFAGKIVKMEAFYGCAFSGMHPTLAKLVRSIIKFQNDRNKFSSDTNTGNEYAPSEPLPKGSKIKGTKIDENTIVINYYIQEKISNSVGDKLVFDSSLKSVTAEVLETPLETESGRKVDALFSGTSISNRIVCSPIIVGIGEQIVQKIEENIVDMYFN
jgi:hypothetical protein